jgi:hypothetical protein
MIDNLRARTYIRVALLQSYLHRYVKDCACSMCGQRGVPLAFHVIEKTVTEIVPGIEGEMLYKSI